MANAPSEEYSGTRNLVVAAPGVIAQDNRQKGVEFIRPELARRFGQYDQISDCIEGDLAVKDRRTAYLPMPNAHDQSEENKARYLGYITRAVFYNVAQVTLAGLIGQVFLVDPEVKVPTLLDAVLKDANGNGVPMNQLAQQVEEAVLSKGRAGILIDFPKVEGGKVSLADQQAGRVRPLVTNYDPENVINWRTTTRNGKIILSLVVLRERHETNDDGFSAEFEIQYRVLRLVDGLYEQQIWRGKEGHYEIKETVAPVDSRGQRLTEIPFTFVGAVDNSPSVDMPPLYALCALNIAHYRNSADYEESVFITGQATPVLTGLTQQWVDTVLKGTVQLGSRAAIPLPVGGAASLLQMGERSAGFEAMEHKEKQMVALGAKLVESKAVQRTATEAKQDKSAEDSTLTTVTKNVSAAIRFALEWCSIFAGTTTVATDANNDTAIVYNLNTDFDISAMSPEEVKLYIEAWQKDALTFGEMRTGLRRAGLATEDDKKAEAAIMAKREADAQFEEAHAPEGGAFGGGAAA